jgi:hypothetical protein
MKPKYSLLVLSAIILSGCAATIRDLSKVQYVKEGFVADSLRTGGLALLPVVAGQGQEGYRRPLADSLNFHIQRVRPNVQFIKWQDAITKLNDKGLAEKYQAAISTYRTTSIIDKSLVSEIGSALGVRYFLFVSLEDFRQSSKLGYSGLTGKLREDQTAKVNAFAQIWDSQTGDVVWEGIGHAEASSSEFTYLKGSYETYGGIAAKGLAQRLP